YQSLLIMKWFISWVLPGFCEVFAKPFLLVNALMREDFPTFERPIKAYSGKFGAGNLSTSVLLTTNSALLTSIDKGNIYPSNSKRAFEGLIFLEIRKNILIISFHHVQQTIQSWILLVFYVGKLLSLCIISNGLLGREDANNTVEVNEDTTPVIVLEQIARIRKSVCIISHTPSQWIHKVHMAYNVRDNFTSILFLQGTVIREK